MAMPSSSSSCFLISFPQHRFGSIRSSNLGGIKHATSRLHAKATYASRVCFRDYTPPSSRTTTFWKPLVTLECKKKDRELVSDIDLGSLVKDSHVFRQNFYIRSYEVGRDQKALVETLMNYLQETILNYFKAIGLFHGGMGSTPEMGKRSLQWAITKLHVVVDDYPTWGDVVQVDTWNVAYGKYGMRSNWICCDCKTGKILVRASSIGMMMNERTRRLSKIPEEVQAELKQMLVDRSPIAEEDTRKWAKLDKSIVDYVRNGIMPIWSDIDANQHVNTFKYVGWIQESVPMTIMDKYELASITLEYHRECTMGDVLQCHTRVLGENNEGTTYDHVDCQHLLQLKVGGGGNDGDEILKGRTKWRPK